jgi:hypothetical protein
LDKVICQESDVPVSANVEFWFPIFIAFTSKNKQANNQEVFVEIAVGGWM